jgi:hypothetical protein
VRDLFVEGRAVVRGGELVTFDANRIVEDAERSLARLMEAA